MNLIYKITNIKTNKSYIGMEGKKHSEETKNQQSKTHKKYWSKLSEKDLEKRCKSISGEKNGMYGKIPSNSIKIKFKNKIYNSISEAVRETNSSAHFIKKHGQII